MDYSIVDTTPADAELLASLIRRSFADVAERFGLTPENTPMHASNTAPEWVLSAMAKGVRYYLMQTPEGAAGCVALERAEPDVCYLERLAVLPPFRRRGLGRALANHVIDEARKLGASRVELGIISAQAELREWYERQGFSVTTTARFDHLPFEVAFMRKVLADDTMSQAETE